MNHYQIRAFPTDGATTDLEPGWEPFAVSLGLIWCLRVVEGSGEALRPLPGRALSAEELAARWRDLAARWRGEVLA